MCMHVSLSLGALSLVQNSRYPWAPAFEYREMVPDIIAKSDSLARYGC
jgi:hypothetical protein